MPRRTPQAARARGTRPARRGGGARPVAFALGAVALVAAIATLIPRHPPVPRHGDEISIGGELRRIGTPVVLFGDRGGYDATLERCWFRPDRVLPERPAPGCDVPERVGPRAGAGPLAERITQLVLHYDQAFTSRNCFKVLHDVRGLSVHFMLDLDGTIYQTCDLALRARHAREANDRSVGVEIAHPGALEDTAGLAGRYRKEEDGVRLDLPPALAADLRTPGFVVRPARPAPVRGQIQGREMTQYDFTDAQYEALARLAAGLARALPGIALEAPRDPDGRIADRAFADPAGARAFRGVLGHYHLQTDKRDPGAAFDWERFLGRARALRGEGN